MKIVRVAGLFSRLQLNLLASFAGTGWSTLMGLAFIPLYIRFMGIEAYGLIGFYLALQGALQVLDFGLSPTMNREMARYSVQPEKAAEARDLVRTLEVGYWAIGLFIGVVIWALAPSIATHWINASDLSVTVVQRAIALMGLLSALQWPLTFYQGGLIGLQRQIPLNWIQIAMSTLNHGGASLTLWLVSPTLTAFLGWQIVVNTLRVGLITVTFWRSLPRASRAPRFDPGLIRQIWRFIAGMSGITLSALILTQLDKVILSKLLSLKLFGYYTLAGVIGHSLTVLIGPIFNVVFPSLSALVAVGDTNAIRRLYHRSAQVMSVTILPVAAILVLFSFDILQLWTGDADLARNVAPIASLLVIGTALNGLMYLPYTLQLAYGWTSLGVRINTFLIIVMVPAILFLTIRYGPIGAASVWFALNSIYMLIGIPLTHRRLLKGEASHWLVQDISLPLTGTILVVGLGRQLLVSPLPPLTAVAGLAAVFAGALMTAASLTPQVRDWATSQVSRLWLLASAPPPPSAK